MALTTRPADLPVLTELAQSLGRPDTWVRSRLALLQRQDVQMLAAQANGRIAGYTLVRVVRRGRRDWRRRLLHWFWYGARPDGAAIIQPQQVGLIDELVLVDDEEEALIVAALWKAAAGWLQAREVGEVQTTVAAEDAAGHRRWHQLGFLPMQTIIEWQGQ